MVCQAPGTRIKKAGYSAQALYGKPKARSPNSIDFLYPVVCQKEGIFVERCQDFFDALNTAPTAAEVFRR